MVDGSFRYSQMYELSCWELNRERNHTVLKGCPVMPSTSTANAAFSSLVRVNALTNWLKDRLQDARDNVSNA